MNQFVYIISFYVDKSLKAFLRCFIRSQINDSLPATCYCHVQPNKSPNFANSLPQIIYCYVFSTMLSNVYHPSTLILHHKK